MEKFCQSCGMPLTVDNVAEGSNKYCNLCFKNGEFIEPNITFQEIKERGLNGISESNDSLLKKFILKLTFPMMLKKLERWNKK
ncbi:zinc ribbon domain-containing protein [Companilactobacillus sp. DQM5]|uniref:zinc ribbon domain-containing protein n=1 Tax=Companilactobacillus sp. DQM5 TaxID=3463359 RepID=UPI00405A303B